MSQISASSTSCVDELTPVLSEKFALRRSHVLTVICFVVAFLYYSYTPIYHSDIWGHVSYGEWMLEHQSLPTEDPILELATGVPVTCTAWLGQVIFGFAHQEFGPQWVSNIFALTTMAMWLVLTVACFLRGRSLQASLLCAVLCLIATWSRHAIVRPEIFGGLCFAALLLMVVLRHSRNAGYEASETDEVPSGIPFYIGVAALFVCWVNLHGSFIVGFAVLGCQLLGRAIECLQQSKGLRGLLQDRVLRQWFVACEVALVASLVNPYGMDLLIHTLLFPSNPNLKDVVEWYSLQMVSYEGFEIGVSWVVLAVLLRHSRVKFRSADVLMLAVFTLAVVMRVRLQSWYAPVFVIVIAPHLADVLKRWRLCEFPSLQTRSFNNSLILLLLIWMGFAFAPISSGVLGGMDRAPNALYSRDTPVELTAWLQENPPQGQVMNPQWWGDWLVEFGPSDMKVFMTTNAVHVAPPRVWKDYLALARAEPGFETLLDRYRVNTIIVQKERQVRTARLVRKLTGWEITYEDDLGFVATRKSVLEAKLKSDDLLAANSSSNVKHLVGHDLQKGTR